MRFINLLCSLLMFFILIDNYCWSQDSVSSEFLDSTLIIKGNREISDSSKIDWKVDLIPVFNFEINENKVDVFGHVEDKPFFIATLEIIKCENRGGYVVLKTRNLVNRSIGYFYFFYFNGFIRMTSSDNGKHDYNELIKMFPRETYYLFLSATSK